MVYSPFKLTDPLPFPPTLIVNLDIIYKLFDIVETGK